MCRTAFPDFSGTKNYLEISKRPLLGPWTVLSILGSLCRYKGLNLRMHMGSCFQQIILGLKHKCSHDVLAHIHTRNRHFRHAWVTALLDSRCLGFWTSGRPCFPIHVELKVMRDELFLWVFEFPEFCNLTLLWSNKKKKKKNLSEDGDNASKNKLWLFTIRRTVVPALYSGQSASF